MKSSLKVIIALFASASAHDKIIPEEDVTLQIGIEADARSNVRSLIQQQLRAYLEDNRYPEWILPNSEVVPVKWSKKSSATDSYLQIDLEEETRQKVSADLRAYLQDNRYPEWILPNSQVVPVKWSKKSSPTDSYVQLDTELDLESQTRAELSAYLHKKLDGKKKKAKRHPNRHPEWILPNSEVVSVKWSKKSSPTDVYVQLTSSLDDEELSVEQARLKAAEMQAQMDQAIAQADAKRAEQQRQYEASIQNDDPASQLQGLMNAQQSLHRLTSTFSVKPNLDKVTKMATNLGIPMTPELMQLGSNEAISNALVEIAVGMGKTEEEIGAALDASDK